MRTSILADARWFGLHGIGRFAQNVLTRLPDCTRLTSGPKPLSILDPLWLSYQILAKRPEVFFSPGFNPPAVCAIPLVITIHDLTHLRLPAFATFSRRLYYRFLVKPASSRAYRVITVSEYSRMEILKWTGLPEDCVVNVGNGVDPTFRCEGPRHEPGFPYILHVGALRPHKNIGRLLSAFERIDSADLHLILTGKETAEIAAQLEKGKLQKRVHFLGCVKDEDLPALYRGAICLILPSLIEGFGLPPLEAMACGTPVIVSRTTALPEVVGNAGLLVDPLDVTDIRNAIEHMLGDAALRRRSREAGLLRARLFCWNTVAEKVRRVVEEAASAPH
ncbi:MAG: glycosyltransferase family 4 protein [Acidobacteriaceae bacterium]|nr:glycosyltransferase family 4 protein [Acidobacteriaceae bacterium]MBV9500777.1 glycosyltransferase family 4 protein [Acidobacteriaceae bacterium]